VSSAFRGWFARMQRHKHIYLIGARVMLRWRQIELSIPFCSLREMSHEQKQHRLIMSKIIRRWQNGALVRAWSMWQDRCTCTKKMARLINVWRNKTLSAAFFGWEEHAQHQRTRRETCQRVILRMKNMCISRALSMWEENAANLAHARSVCERTVQRMQHMCVARAMACWQERTATLVYQRETCEKVVARWLMRSLAIAFFTWVEEVDTRKAEQAAEEHAQVRERHIKLSASHDSTCQELAASQASVAQVLPLTAGFCM
jgi:hypothetical protein